MFLTIAIFALSAIGQTNTDALPALAPPYGKLPPSFWEHHGASILTGAFILLGLAAIVLWMIFKPKPPPVLPPANAARQALARLQGRPEDGKCLSEISQILRRYVIKAFAWPPGEMTTAEFSAALAGDENIGAPLAQTISDFLRECDERKFSPAIRSSAFTQVEPPEGGIPNLSAPMNAANRALEIIGLAERIKDRRDASPTHK